MDFLRVILEELQKIKTPGDENYTGDLQIKLTKYREKTVCPFDWGLTDYRSRPMYLDGLKTKNFHLEYEGQLRPYLLRIMATVEFMSQGDIENALIQIKIAVDLFMYGTKKGMDLERLQPYLYYIIITTFARMFEMTGYPQSAMRVFLLLPVEPFKEFEMSVFSGFKAIICTNYGLQGQVEALEQAVWARLSPTFQTEWRFLFVHLMAELYDINLGEEVIRSSTSHMGYEFETDPKKPANTFSQYFRITWESRNIAEAQSLIRRSIHDLMGCTELERKEAMDRRVVTALEADPLNREILNSAARYFMLRKQVHKSLSLYWVGRNTYKCCAEGLLEVLSLTFPYSEYKELEDNLEYFGEKWSLPIIKRAALLMLGSNWPKALALASRAFQIESLPSLNVDGDRPMTAFGGETTLGFYNLMLCVAQRNRNVDESGKYLKDVRSFLRESIKPTGENMINWIKGWTEITDLIRFVGMKKIPEIPDEPLLQITRMLM